VVVLVVPVIQNIHIKSSYGDYLRPTTLAIAKLFKRYGFEPLVIKTNDQPFAPIYCFAIAVKNLERYQDRVDEYADFQMGRFFYGNGLKKEDLYILLKD